MNAGSAIQIFDMQREMAAYKTSQDIPVKSESSSFHKLSAKIPKKAMIKQLPPKDRAAPRLNGYGAENVKTTPNFHSLEQAEARRSKLEQSLPSKPIMLMSSKDQ